MEKISSSMNVERSNKDVKVNIEKIVLRLLVSAAGKRWQAHSRQTTTPINSPPTVHPDSAAHGATTWQPIRFPMSRS
ncbi:unnamed protein product [Schistosoma curassoni]|uniref:Uncharacterized protein n=1 Tax=Schistosoma curassoni TaxID=6186 RepID=A0A183K0I7_9TREM|nr:unnamed protein product [Schistosoma curassoni]